MSQPSRDQGSFRDPSGRVFHHEDQVFRTVMPIASQEFADVRTTGLIDKLVADEFLIPEKRVDQSILGQWCAQADIVLEHPRIPFISYPYEWSFTALKSAALLHLDIHLLALEYGVTLSDASAYNVQFVGSKPIFIDSLSFKTYREGDYWSGHRQFCEQFLNPLLLRVKLGVQPNAWYRGALEGISTESLNSILPWYKKLSWNLFIHVSLQARLQIKSRATTRQNSKLPARPLPLVGFREILYGLRKWISRLEIADSTSSTWQNYAISNHYQHSEEVEKRDFIIKFSRDVAPKMLWDLGCNSGDYAALALNNGARYAVGFDLDAPAIEKAFHRAQHDSLAFLPLISDAVNPSPSQGWAEKERPGIIDRANADAVLVLALLHHLVIGKNIPLTQAVAWIVSLAPQGIIEFVEKSDPMVQQLLSLRKDIFDDYSRETFEDSLWRVATIKTKTKITAHGRTLYWYKRN